MDLELQNGSLKGYLTTDEYAKRNNFKVDTVRQWINRGKLPYVKFGSGFRSTNYIPENAVPIIKKMGRRKKNA